MSRAFDPVQLGSIELFCKTAELGSFTATAQVLGVTPASVSRSIQRIEARLGVKLFNRTTRSVRLTEDGELYRAQCQQALDQIAEAERALTGRQRHPKGLLRVSVGTVYAHHRLVPLLPGFMAAYPEIELELNVSNRNIDFVEDGYDLAIRLGEPRDSRVIARKLEEASVGVFCSPAYAARRPPPTSLDALHQHDLIQFITPARAPFPWSFIDDKGCPSRSVSTVGSGYWRMYWRALAGRWLAGVCSRSTISWRQRRSAKASWWKSWRLLRGDPAPSTPSIPSTATSLPGCVPSWITCWRRCAPETRASPHRRGPGPLLLFPVHPLRGTWAARANPAHRRVLSLLCIPVNADSGHNGC
ncbi:LysR family transcriptional regulator [Aeromonas rivipollensis]